jgi:hypothetical protein
MFAEQITKYLMEYRRLSKWQLNGRFVDPRLSPSGYQRTERLIGE